MGERRKQASSQLYQWKKTESHYVETQKLFVLGFSRVLSSCSSYDLPFFENFFTQKSAVRLVVPVNRYGDSALAALQTSILAYRLSSPYSAMVC